jgi:hypothetical protein
MSGAMKTYFVAAVLVASACGKDKGGDKGGGAPAVKIDPAAANALVPAELKEKIVFEQRDIVEERGKDKVTYTLAAPKGWENSNKMFAKLRPKDDLGFMTSLDVGTNCDGSCEPKDWAKTSEKVNFAQFRDGKIVKDESNDTSHLMIAEKNGTTYVVYAWWGKGAKKYASCMATLEAPAAPAAPAFAEACKAVSIKGDD